MTFPGLFGTVLCAVLQEAFGRHIHGVGLGIAYDGGAALGLAMMILSCDGPAYAVVLDGDGCSILIPA